MRDENDQLQFHEFPVPEAMPVVYFKYSELLLLGHRGILGVWAAVKSNGVITNLNNTIMLQNQETYNLRMALNEALVNNDFLSRHAERLERETHTDRICGFWCLSETQDFHIRKIQDGQYRLSVWNGRVRMKNLTLVRTDRGLRVVDANDQFRGWVYYFPENDSLLIEGVGLCTSIEKSDA